MKIGLITDAHMFHKNTLILDYYNTILTDYFRDCDIIVDCGDLTDKSSLTAPQLDTLSKLYNNVNKPVYIVAGNHDSLSNTTVASIFNLKQNVYIITEPTKIDNLLFIPYTDNIKELFIKLNMLLDEPCDYAFSHLNITSNIYASIPFKDIKKLYKYAKVYFNGHIHNTESNITAFGSFYNIGSCSNLTFGDEHKPCYSIYDTDSNELTTFEIEDSILHKSYKLNDKVNLDDVYDEVKNELSNYRLRCKFYLQNSPDNLEIRKQIREKLKTYDNVIDIIFDYIKCSNTEQKIKTESKKLSKASLIEQLFQHFEEDTQIKLDDNIKKELLKL